MNILQLKFLEPTLTIKTGAKQMKIHSSLILRWKHGLLESNAAVTIKLLLNLYC